MSNNFWKLAALGALFGGCGVGRIAFTQEAQRPNAPAFSSARAAVLFSPKGGASKAIIREIEGAKAQILVQAYSFTSPPIVNALKKAHERGVVVFVLLDKSNLTGKYSGATFLLNAGVPVGIDDRHAIAHSKIIIIDPDTKDATVLTGSFNFSKAAEEKNAENLLILKECPALVSSYAANWKAHAAHSYKLDSGAGSNPNGGKLPKSAAPPKPKE